MSLDGAARRRFGRQIRLAEVGEQGQIDLCRARVTAADDVERAYLVAAGVGVEEGAARPMTDEVVRALDGLALETEEARAFAEGALRALKTIRTILDVG